MKLGTMVGVKTIICERSKERQKATVIQGHITNSLMKIQSCRLKILPTMEIRLGLNVSLFIIHRS